MSITREELAAFADGQLDAEREAEVAAAVVADPLLAEQVRAHRALGERLAKHFAPILEAPLPEQLTEPLQRPGGDVADFALARRQRQQRTPKSLPRWAWLAGPALAASLALAIFLPRSGQEDYAEGALAAALEQQLVAAQDQTAPERILLSFRDDDGAYCRAFVTHSSSGIACRDEEGWRLRETDEGAGPQDVEYRMAGSPTARILEQVQAIAAGPALDAEQERQARARNWR